MTGCYDHGDEFSDFIESGKVLFTEQLSDDEQTVDSRPKQLLLLGKLTLARLEPEPSSSTENNLIFLSPSHPIPVGLAPLLPLFHFSSTPSRGLYQVTIIPPPPTLDYKCAPPLRFRFPELRNCRRAAGTLCSQSDDTRDTVLCPVYVTPGVRTPGSSVIFHNQIPVEGLKMGHGHDILRSHGPEHEDQCQVVYDAM
jgi:hypothetical protein